LVDPALPPVAPKLSSQERLLLAQSKQESRQDFLTPVVLAAEEDMSLVGQGLEIAEVLVKALDSAIRDPDDRNAVNEELDASVVLDLLDALPSALNYAASGVSATLVNCRLARRDAELASSSLERSVRDRLRACSISDQDLFGPDLVEVVMRAREREVPLTATGLADAFALALAKHSQTQAPTKRSKTKVSKRFRKNIPQPAATKVAPRTQGRGRGRGSLRGRGRGQSSQQKQGN
jgi:hypothetical protein